MTNLRVVIADDEELVRRSIRRFLRDREIESVTECTDGCEAVEAIRRESPNLVFLDLQMPKLHGMDVIGTIGEEHMPPTVIITAYADYAVDAFNVHVVDYLLKPFGRERFSRAVARARQRIEMIERPDANSRIENSSVENLLKILVPRPEYAERLAVPRNGRIYLIATSEVEWLEAKGNVVLIHCQRETYEVRRPLHAIQKQLDPKVFLRLHRSTLVNVRFIREIQPWSKGHHIVVLKSGQELRMSRYQQDGMEDLLGASFCLR